MRVLCAEAIPLIRDALRQGGYARLTATGMSMRPFIWPGEVVELTTVTPDTLAPGMIVLVKADEGRHLLHRVTRIAPDAVFTRGDANLHEEGPFPFDCIVARVTGVVRGDRVAPFDTGIRRALACLWYATTASPRVIAIYDRSRWAVGSVLRWLGLRS